MCCTFRHNFKCYKLSKELITITNFQKNWYQSGQRCVCWPADKVHSLWRLLWGSLWNPPHPCQSSKEPGELSVTFIVWDNSQASSFTKHIKLWSFINYSSAFSVSPGHMDGLDSGDQCQIYPCRPHTWLVIRGGGFKILDTNTNTDVSSDTKTQSDNVYFHRKGHFSFLLLSGLDFHWLLILHDNRLLNNMVLSHGNQEYKWRGEKN